MINKFLGIEYSCDDTSVAIVSSDKNVIFHKTISQSYTTGVVPEIAARRHLHTLHDIVLDINISDLQGIAATFGPGLISSLMTGVNFAKGLSLAYGIPLYKVNHLEAHMLSVSLTEDIPYPYLSLLISGGHTQLVLVKSVHEFEILGNTIDDALGECFDKIAKSIFRHRKKIQTHTHCEKNTEIKRANMVIDRRVTYKTPNVIGIYLPRKNKP